MAVLDIRTRQLSTRCEVPPGISSTAHDLARGVVESDSVSICVQRMRMSGSGRRRTTTSRRGRAFARSPRREKIGLPSPSLLLFTAWSSAAHGLLMAGQAIVLHKHGHLAGDVSAMLLLGFGLAWLMPHVRVNDPRFGRTSAYPASGYQGEFDVFL
jgi:hypothetical protein